MIRTLTVCALTLGIANLGVAQQNSKVPRNHVIQLTVSPAAVPIPSLKYQLLPELKEMQAGNPVLGYLKCFSEQHNFFHSKEAHEQRSKWLKMPLKELPVEQMKNYGGTALRRADDAARLTNADWQVLSELKRDGIATLVPEIQEIRTLAVALAVRLRGEVAAKRYDDAIVTLKTMFALSRHCQEHPTLIAHLVGVALAMITSERLEEMMEQPDCPSLFWALATLPDPLIDLNNKTLQGERMIALKEFSLIDTSAVMTNDEINKAVEKLKTTYYLLPSSDSDRIEYQEVLNEFKEKSKNNDLVTKLRQKLQAYGLGKKVVNNMPPMQVILANERMTFEVGFDERLRLMPLPYWRSEKYYRKLAKDSETNTSPASKFLNSWIGDKIRIAHTRLRHRLAMLQHIEAVRMYAAEHDGKLPKTLDDIGVPLPVNPVTGEAFGYSVKGDTAMLNGGPLTGIPDQDAWKYQYEITLRK